MPSWRDRAGTLFECEKHPVFGSAGVVATNHPLGSAAGLEMLAQGGNAFDAAIAALFALSVVEPMMVGVLGSGWINLRLSDGTPVILDDYSTSPSAATPDLYTPLSDTWPDYLQVEGNTNKVGYLAVGVPAALLGWEQVLRDYGRMDLDAVIRPAIGYAEDGIPASGYLCEIIGESMEDLDRFPETASIFLPGGAPPTPGHRIRQRDLGATLRTIASEGCPTLYGGALGRTIVDHVRENGGILRMEDLENYQVLERPPLSTSYRGYDLTWPSPPCFGGVHITQILKILEGYDLASLGYGTPDSLHLLAESFKIAFADREKYSGDPETIHIPLEWLTSAEYGASRRKDIDSSATIPQKHGVLLESANTTHVTAADADGNIACMTQTINETFGSKVMVPGTGLLLNNFMALFDPHPGHANSVGPSKRMVSSNSPTIVAKDGQPVLSIGTPGGVRIFPSILQALVNVIDHGMTLQEAVEAPRIWTQGQELEMESAFGQDVRDDLGSRGHGIAEVRAVAGCMNGIRFDEEGFIEGASCWRGDGSPVALGGGPARKGIRFRPTAGR